MHLKPIILYYHIPKTGGTSILDYLERHLAMNLDFHHTEAEDGPELEQVSDAIKDGFRAVIGHRVNEFTAEHFKKRLCLYHVTIREPFSRIVSNLNYRLFWLAEGHPYYTQFFPWVQNMPDFITSLKAGEVPAELNFESYLTELSKVDGWPDFQCFWLKETFRKWASNAKSDDLFLQAKAVLEQFDDVGVTSNLMQYGNRLSQLMDLPKFDFHSNRSKGYVRKDDVEHLFPPDICQADQQLFEFSKQLEQTVHP